MMTLPISFGPDVAPLTVTSWDSITANSVELFLSCNTLCQISSNSDFLIVRSIFGRLCAQRAQTVPYRAGTRHLTSNATNLARATEPRQRGSRPIRVTVTSARLGRIGIELQGSHQAQPQQFESMSRRSDSPGGCPGAVVARLGGERATTAPGGWLQSGRPEPARQLPSLSSIMLWAIQEDQIPQVPHTSRQFPRSPIAYLSNITDNQ